MSQSINIRIPFKAAAVLVSKRKRRGNHVTVGKALNTNRMEKWFGFYFSLKALTTSGKITNFLSQIELIKAVTRKESTTTIYSYIHQCERLGLIRKDGTDLHLSSWEKCFDKLNLAYHDKVQFIEFKYEDISHIKASPEYHIEAAEIAESSHFSLRAIAKKINQNVQLKQLLGIRPENNATLEDARRLFDLQLESFATGKIGSLVASEEDYQLLHSVQACPYRNSASLVKARAQGWLKSTKQHIARLKRKLSELGLAIVQDLSCNSEARKRANSEYFFRGWDKENCQPRWNIPTEVSVFAKIA